MVDQQRMNILVSLHKFYWSKTIYSKKKTMNYIHLFKTPQEHGIKYDGSGYTEPWVAYVTDTKDVKYNKQYVWVTPNAIDPAKHDMIIYDMKINGKEQEIGGVYDLELPYQSYVNQYASSTNLPYFDYGTGKYKRYNNANPYEGDETFLTAICDMTYVMDGDMQYNYILMSNDYQSQLRLRDGGKATFSNDDVIGELQFPLDWTGASNLPTEEEWNLSWLLIKTRLK